MSKNKKQTEILIWSTDIDVEDFREGYENEDFNEGTDISLEEYAYGCNNDYLQDEIHLLDKKLDENIVCIAELGLWDGTKSAYKEMGNNLNCIFNVSKDDDIKFYCDRYNVRATGNHHDGTNTYLFRVWKNKLTDEVKENFLNKVYNGTLTDKDITRYTKSLRPFVKEIYGFK